jgi:hypothetical protein
VTEILIKHIFRRIFAKVGIPDFDKVHVQMLGAEESFGPKQAKFTREVNIFSMV